ncbi:MAG: GtrA family protein, partial [Actinobacteria bacterium]|nr:GtrA family protein [Actinomycetota bacterium]
AFSNYVLDLHTPLADNTANVLSVAVGTAFRFWAYRRYVFSAVT